MILKNYWLIKGYTAQNAPIIAQNGSQVSIGLIDTDGNSVGFCNGWSQSSMHVVAQNWVSMYELNAMVGSGTTDPTDSDYTIEDDETSNFSNYNVTVNSNTNDGKLITTITVTGINASANNVTISELLIYRSVLYWDYSYLTPKPKSVALIRALLDTPLTVESGKGFTLTFEWGES